MVQPVQLFDLAAQQARWLSARQSAVAGNIANANTPGYTGVDVAPFEQVLDNTAFRLAATAPGHIAPSGGANTAMLRENGNPSLLPSENTVELEQELMKTGEIRRAFELNTAIVKAFHRMMTMTTKA